VLLRFLAKAHENVTSLMTYRARASFNETLAVAKSFAARLRRFQHSPIKASVPQPTVKALPVHVRVKPL